MRTIILFLLIFIAGQVFSQEDKSFTPIGILEGEHNYLKKDIKTYKMPLVDVEKLKTEDLDNDLRKDIPWRFGYRHHVHYSIKKAGTKDILPSGANLWRVRIYSKGAVSLNIMFKNFELPQDAKLTIYNPATKEYIGAYTKANNNDAKVLGSDIIQGEAVIVEYYEPANIRSSADITISEVVHGYRPLSAFMKSQKSSGYCNVDASCYYENWEKQISSVALISTGVSVCSGALVNNTANDGTPYFLTANHCYSAPGVSNWNFKFNFEEPCSSNPSSTPGQFTIYGSELKARNSDSDFMLLELNSTPPQGAHVFYSGWDRVVADSLNGSHYGIHHPAGDFKKISISIYGAVRTMNLGSNYNTTGTHWRVKFHTGTAEGGSSGSPLFNEDQRIIGQLQDGYASCDNMDGWEYYGMFGRSWGQASVPEFSLAPWLDPLGIDPSNWDGYDPNAPTIDYDIAVTEIISPDTNACGSELLPVIKIENLGFQTVHSLDISYSINNGPSIDSTYAVELEYYDEIELELPAGYASSSNCTLNITISNPNGNTDENTSNNSLSHELDVLQASQLPFFEDFEQVDFPYQDYTIVNTDNLNGWERIQTGGNSPGQYSATMQCYNYDAGYGEANEMILPLVHIPEGGDATITFKVAYAIRGEDYEGLRVAVSTDCGATYQDVYSKYAYSLKTTDNINYSFTPYLASHWRTDTIDLSYYDLEGKNIFIKFEANANGGNNIYVDDINVFSNAVINTPDANFTANQTQVSVGEMISFTDQSTDNPTSWLWNFGDGNSSTTQNPTHSYSSAGTYTVSLTATNNAGSNTETKTDYITVAVAGNAPTANFSANQTNVNTGDVITFTDLSTDNPTSWLWNFGDGNTSTTQNPTHSYTNTGVYTVSLTATNSIGSDTETKTDYITVAVAGNAPTANFSASQTNINTGDVITFTDQSTNNPTSWNWNFGDGNTSTTQNPTHSYSSAGTYSVSLTATNSIGSDTETKTDYITVTAGVENDDCSEATVLIQNQTCISEQASSIGATQSIGAIICNNYTGNSDDDVWFMFEALSESVTVDVTPLGGFDGVIDVRSGSCNGTNIACSDNNGAYGVESVNLNSLNIGEIYYVRVYEYQAGGGEFSICVYGEVSEQLEVDFTANQTDVNVGDAVTFSDLTTGNPASWAWDFGDGNTSTTQNPTHSYSSAGTYTVSLTATNSAGSNTETKTDYITVTVPGDAPMANFTANQTDANIGDEISFTDLSTGNPTSWSWDFGNGSGSSLQNPTYIYASEGIYTITLTVTNAHGSDTETKTDFITINIPGYAPVADFSVDDNTISIGEPVSFSDLSTGNINSWLWDFGDGTNSTSQNPVYVYSNLGTYSVSLTVSGDFGDDTETKTDFIIVDVVDGKNKTLIKEISIYPNPVQEYFIISGIKNKTQIQLQNTTGKTVLTKEINKQNNKITTKDLASGVYFVNIHANGFYVTKKIILID